MLGTASAKTDVASGAQRGGVTALTTVDAFVRNPQAIA
jgi:hypothetical protein